MSVCRTLPMHTMHVAVHSQQRSADPLMPPGRRNLQRLPALLPSELPLPQFIGRLAGRGLTRARVSTRTNHSFLGMRDPSLVWACFRGLPAPDLSIVAALNTLSPTA